MKIEKSIISRIEQEAQFFGLTLLSVEEYKQYVENIPTVNFWWWLRSPGYYGGYASRVDYDGSLNSNFVDFASGSVRPTLIINPKLSCFQIGDKFKFFNHSWTVISDNYALCDEAFCKMQFRKNLKAENANIYNESDVKKYLDSEWIKIKYGEQPTVDVVTVVRCKDCIHKNKYGICNLHIAEPEEYYKGYYCFNVCNDDFYCAYGERE